MARAKVTGEFRWPCCIYSPKELEQLVEGLEAPDWTWEIGRFRLKGAPGNATYLVGRPRSPGLS